MMKVPMELTHTHTHKMQYDRIMCRLLFWPPPERLVSRQMTDGRAEEQSEREGEMDTCRGRRAGGMLEGARGMKRAVRVGVGLGEHLMKMGSDPGGARHWPTGVLKRVHRKRGGSGEVKKRIEVQGEEEDKEVEETEDFFDST